MKYKLASNKHHVLDTQNRISNAAIKALPLFCLEISEEQAQKKGISQSVLNELQQSGLIHEVEACDHWEKYNWQQATSVGLEALSKPCDTQLSIAALEANSQNFDLKRQLLRRSVRFYASRALPNDRFVNFLQENSHLLSDSKWLEFYFVIQKVEGIKRGIYRYDSGSLKMIKHRVPIKEINASVQNMWWVNGSGFGIYTVVDIHQLTQEIPNHDRGYHDLFINLGRVNQELLHSVEQNKMGAWMTPAIKESLAHNFLELPEHKEALYFLRVGEPSINSIKDMGKSTEDYK